MMWQNRRKMKRDVNSQVTEMWTVVMLHPACHLSKNWQCWFLAGLPSTCPFPRNALFSPEWVSLFSPLLPDGYLFFFSSNTIARNPPCLTEPLQCWPCTLVISCHYALFKHKMKWVAGRSCCWRWKEEVKLLQVANIWSLKFLACLRQGRKRSDYESDYTQKWETSWRWHDAITI